jgi:DNA-binding response OmpR family regulator
MSLEAGCNDFLHKPVDLEQLLAYLQKYLKLEWRYEELAVANLEAAEQTTDVGIASARVIHTSNAVVYFLLSIP